VYIVAYGTFPLSYNRTALLNGCRLSRWRRCVLFRFRRSLCHFCEILFPGTADWTYIGRLITLMDIPTHCTFPFLHICSSLYTNRVNLLPYYIRYLQCFATTQLSFKSASISSIFACASSHCSSHRSRRLEHLS